MCEVTRSASRARWASCEELAKVLNALILVVVRVIYELVATVTDLRNYGENREMIIMIRGRLKEKALAGMECTSWRFEFMAGKRGRV